MDLVVRDARGVLFVLMIIGVVVAVAGMMLMIFVKHKAMRWLGSFIIAAGTIFSAFALLLLLSDLRVR